MCDIDVYVFVCVFVFFDWFVCVFVVCLIVRRVVDCVCVACMSWSEGQLSHLIVSVVFLVDGSGG